MEAFSKTENAVAPGMCAEHGEFPRREIFGRVMGACGQCVEKERAALDASRAALQASHERARAEAYAADRPNRHARQLAISGVPRRFIGRTLETFDASQPGQVAALNAASLYVEKFAEARKTGGGLIFSGKPGTGKSHLACAIAQALLDYRVLYTTCMDMIRSIRETWARDSAMKESEALERYEGFDLLVIDEIGMQYGTEAEQNILFDVLDRRYREVKPTILLTNQSRDGFSSYVGERVLDRMRETSRWIACDWESHRPAARLSPPQNGVTPSAKPGNLNLIGGI